MNRQTSSDLAEVMTALAGHRIKHVTAEVKRAPTDGSGRFTAIVSTFGPPPDAQNDVIAPGAFLLSIADWRARGRRPALWWMHDYANPAATLGTVEKMFENDEGLVIEGQLDLSHEPAVAVYEGLLAGRLSEWSIGYAVISEHEENSKAYGTYRVLDEVELLEVSVVSAGANRYTRVLEVKHVPRPLSELERLNKQLDELAGPVVRKAEPGQVDRFVTEVREEMVREKLAEAKQAAWERQMRNLVVDRVSVRVDARMRPDR